MLHRGHGRVARKLVGLLFDGAECRRRRAPIRSGDREIGRVTSSTWSPALQRPIALGYVHRDFVEPGTAVTIGDASAAWSRRCRSLRARSGTQPRRSVRLVAG